MTCGEARELIHGMIDGELGSGEVTDLEAHLSDCGECRRYADVFSALKGRVAAMRDEAEKSVGVSRVRAFLDSKTPPSRVLAGYGARPRFTYAAAAAVLVAFGVFAALAVFAPSKSLAHTTIEQHRLRTAGKLVLDSHAHCCTDLQEWFEAQVEHPVDVPEIAFEGIEVDGGKLYRHASGNEIFYIACSLEGRPVSIFICCGPDMKMPGGDAFDCARPGAVVAETHDSSSISWRRGEAILVLVSPFDTHTNRRLCEAVE